MAYRTTRCEIGTHRGHTLYEAVVYEVGAIAARPKIVSQYIGFTIKGGDYKKKKDRCEFYVNNKSAAISAINRIEDEKEVILTENEHRMWVTDPNRKHEWGFSKESMLRLYEGHKKEKCPRRRKGYIERLVDANFHSFATAIEDGDDEEFKQLMSECFD